MNKVLDIEILSKRMLFPSISVLVLRRWQHFYRQSVFQCQAGGSIFIVNQCSSVKPVAAFLPSISVLVSSRWQHFYRQSVFQCRAGGSIFTLAFLPYMLTYYKLADHQQTLNNFFELFSEKTANADILLNTSTIFLVSICLFFLDLCFSPSDTFTNLGSSYFFQKLRPFRVPLFLRTLCLILPQSAFIFSKLAIKTLEQGVKYVSFEQISHLILVFLLLPLNM